MVSFLSGIVLKRDNCSKMRFCNQHCTSIFCYTMGTATNTPWKNYNPRRINMSPVKGPFQNENNHYALYAGCDRRTMSSNQFQLRQGIVACSLLAMRTLDYSGKIYDLHIHLNPNFVCLVIRSKVEVLTSKQASSWSRVNKYILDTRRWYLGFPLKLGRRSFYFWWFPVVKHSMICMKPNYRVYYILNAEESPM